MQLGVGLRLVVCGLGVHALSLGQQVFQLRALNRWTDMAVRMGWADSQLAFAAVQAAVELDNGRLDGPYVAELAKVLKAVLISYRKAIAEQDPFMSSCTLLSKLWRVAGGGSGCESWAATVVARLESLSANPWSVESVKSECLTISKAANAVRMNYENGRMTL